MQEYVFGCLVDRCCGCCIGLQRGLLIREGLIVVHAHGVFRAGECIERAFLGEGKVTYMVTSKTNIFIIMGDGKVLLGAR